MANGKWQIAKPGFSDSSEEFLNGLLDNGYVDTALDDSRTDGVAGEACDVVDVQFAHEMLPMLVDRFEADAQFRGDLFVGLAFGDQLEHLYFARTQAVIFLLEVPFPIH